jgi:uncharacterized protein YprB with RNaseH-like and TPR domain
MRTLFLDIETTPNVAHVWGLFKQNVGLNQLMESTRMLCFTAAWSKSPVEFYSPRNLGDHRAMVEKAHELLDQADAVVHYNGERFDVPHLNREFLEAGLNPPSPFKQIDLVKAAKRVFRFPSNKLDYVSQVLGLAGKVHHEGHTLWVKCMEGDDEAWARMEEYARQDVALLEPMYERLRPWIPGHPNVALYNEALDGELVCPACGSGSYQRRGYAFTAVTRYQRYQCQDCGKWFRDGRRAGASEGRNVAS